MNELNELLDIARRRSRIRLIVAMALLATVLGALVFLLLMPIPGENRDVIIALLGVLTGSFGTAVNFYFGDSEGGKNE